MTTPTLRQQYQALQEAMEQLVDRACWMEEEGRRMADEAYDLLEKDGGAYVYHGARAERAQRHVERRKGTPVDPIANAYNRDRKALNRLRNGGLIDQATYKRLWKEI